MAYKQRAPKVQTYDIQTGKVPPHAKDLEEAILGAIMLEKGAIEKVYEFIKNGEVFYFTAHVILYDAMVKMYMNGLPIDILTVTEYLNKIGKLKEVGGPYYVSKLTNIVGSTANIETHAQIVYQYHVRRKIIEISGNLIARSYDFGNDPFDLLDLAGGQLSDISLDGLTQETHISQSVIESLNDIDKNVAIVEENKKNGTSSIFGVQSGYKKLDNIFNGWQKTDLIILAARPAVGKTAFALNLVRGAALSEKKTPVAFFSLEMSTKQLVRRLLSIESQVPLDRINKANFYTGEKEMVDEAAGRISQMPIYVDDTAALSIFEFRAKARRLVEKFGVGLIIIDYLQLMIGNGNNRQEEISEISRNLKTTAKELDIPIIALSQLSRGVEQRSEKVPQLSDLRESGAIEQDADAVCFIYREEEKTIVKIAKHRNGSLDSIPYRANLHIQQFEEIEGDFNPF